MVKEIDPTNPFNLTTEQFSNVSDDLAVWTARDIYLSFKFGSENPETIKARQIKWFNDFQYDEHIPKELFISSVQKEIPSWSNNFPSWIGDYDKSSFERMIEVFEEAGLMGAKEDA